MKNKKVDWDKPITFPALKKGFDVKAIRINFLVYKISTVHLTFCVDTKGTPINEYLGSAFQVTNMATSKN